MESISIENLSFTYPGRRNKALDNINLTVSSGEFILLCGKSGCGKTTLLRVLKPALSPFGDVDGCVLLDGKPLAEYSMKEQTALVGFVMQNPDNQIVTDKVWHELAFGLESLGYKTSEIRTRVSEMASFFGIQNWFYKNVDELSGGQKQLLNLAAVMVMQPSVLILDEPTSQLDPISAGEFLKTLEKINRELGTTIILTEHRLEETFSAADRVIVMDGGKIIADNTPMEVGKILKDSDHDMYKALPTPVLVHGGVESSLPCPLTVRDGRQWLSEYVKENELNPDAIPSDDISADGDVVIEIKGAWFRYEKNLPDVVKDFNMKVKKGELFCLVGGNGTGKTTAVSLVSGINKPYRGNVFIKGQNISKIRNLYAGLLGVLPQNPQSLFVKNTVYMDMMEMLSERKMPEEEKKKKVKNVAMLCRIEEILDSHPYDLSGGEQQRAALAKVLLMEPEILLLDEPTKGMDAHFKEEFADILKELKSDGVTVVMVSHDIEFCAKYADRCALVFDGNITSEGMPREFFKGKNFYTTSANRMARNVLPDAILTEDIIRACGGNVQKKEKKDRKTEFTAPKNEIKKEKTVQQTGKKASKRALISSFFVLLLIPFTIYMGDIIFDNRKYYFISLLIIFETMIPFFMMFESRKPKAREVVLISVLCGIAVAGRMAFLMIPQFKFVAAIVIIAGVCFGGETGFLVGCVTGFVSNFFFGQGPWTPWQMFAFGVIGFLAGLFFKNSTFKENKVLLCIFGFFATFIVYGGITNPASVIMWQDKITWEMIATACLSGVSFDLIHALATVFFLWFLSKPMIEKLERIKIKYGFIE